jgi:Bacteriocin class II with double-glycine leader peptide
VNPENMTMNTQSTYELTHQELDLVNGGSFSLGGILGAGLAGAAGGVAGGIKNGNWGSAVGGFIFGAVGEFIKEMRS